MNGKMMGLILCAWLLAPGLAAAQSAPPAQERTPAQRAQMDEDIEVMRRLLDSKLQSQYQPARRLKEAWTWNNCASCHSTGTAWAPLGQGLDSSAPNHEVSNFFQPTQPPLSLNAPGSPWLVDFDNNRQMMLSTWATPGGDRWRIGLKIPQHWAFLHDGHGFVERLLDTEGVYLKGQGVIYTLTLPPPQRKPKADAGQAAARPVSDWDRVRGELRHEKTEGEARERPRKEPSLTEIILQVLADNGHHFTQLGENESLTVVVTFRGADPPAAQEAKGGAPAIDNDGRESGAAPAAPVRLFHSDPPSSAHDYELLGDLHLKQGKADEAAKAYRQALDQEDASKQGPALLRKLAQALLAQGKDAEARQALDRVLAQQKKDPASPPPARDGEAARSPLPAKLIIIAPKKLLDQAAGGKMTLDDFRKGTTIESVRPTPADE